MSVRMGEVMKNSNRSRARILTWSLALASLLVVSTAVMADGDGRGVALRSGVIEPGQAAQRGSLADASGLARVVVRFSSAPGLYERGRLQSVGARIETPLPGQAYLVSIPAARATELSAVPGVDWAEAYLPSDKIAPEIARVSETLGASDDVIVLLHLFADADASQVAEELTAAGLQVEGSGNGARFDRIVLRMTANEVDSRHRELAERNDVFWISRRHRRTLQMDNVVWVDQSGLDGGMTTPIHDHGLHGEGQIGAVLDTGIDADACQFRDETLGLPPTNVAGGTTVDTNQRKVVAVDFLDPTENPADPTDWDTQGHGTRVAGIMAGDDLATPIEHDSHDGMATGAQLVIQDAGYAADACGDLPGIGCPVTDLNPIFQQAYDQGARVHNNSWNDNENAQVQNQYTDASEDVDEFMWNNPDFLVMIAVGNRALGGDATIGSPSTAKNCTTVGGTYNGTSALYLSDISAWGPTDDGRLKPDVLSPAASINGALNDGNVTTDNCSTGGGTGTSYASPGAGGAALMIRQYFAEGWYPSGAATPADGFDPSAALVKAMLVNSGAAIEFDAEGRPDELPSMKQGWGRILLDDAMHFAGDARGLWVDENTTGFSGPGDAPVNYVMEVGDASQPLEVTLTWTDYPSTPAAATHLVNDLDLRVDGVAASYWGNAFRGGASWNLGDADRLNNVEHVLIPNPTPGTYSIQVSPHAIPSGPQRYALVVTGGDVTVSAGPRPAYVTHAIDDSGPNGNGDGVLDPGETAKIAITLKNTGDAAATSVLGHLYSAHPDTLKVYDGTASYADMAVNASATSASPHFEVTLQPSAACGQWIDATMAVDGDGFSVGSGLKFDLGVYEGDRPSTDTPKVIPKNIPEGVYSYLNVPSTFPVTEVDVTLDIAHGDISELRVVLYAPDNSLVILHDQTGAGVSGIHTTYDELTQPATGSLDQYIGKNPQGTWRLRIQDYVGQGTAAGTLEGWTLHFKSDTPFDCHPVGCGEGVPPEVGNTLTVDRSGASDVVVAWGGVGGASNYNVWRSATRQMTTAAVAGSTAGTSVVDAGAQTLPGVHYYQARSVNSCRWESP